MRHKELHIGPFGIAFMFDIAQWWVGVSFQNDQVAPAVVIHPVPCLSVWVWWIKP